MLRIKEKIFFKEAMITIGEAGNKRDQYQSLVNERSKENTRNDFYKLILLAQTQAKLDMYLEQLNQCDVPDFLGTEKELLREISEVCARFWWIHIHFRSLNRLNSKTLNTTVLQLKWRWQRSNIYFIFDIFFVF